MVIAMPTMFEIRGRGDQQDSTLVDVVQIELGRNLRPVTMAAGMSISTAISLVVNWASTPDVTGWITYKALESWLASWGSRTYFHETGVDWDAGDCMGMLSTNPIDKKLTNAVQGLGRRLGHKPIPIAVAQVIEAYLEAQEYAALVGYLKSITAETAQVML